ncbi:MAG: PilZ domain-containing protein [Acidobacteriia bacterium]|nr:PilZ domain-containing protein [Terriglobia bacterium]
MENFSNPAPGSRWPNGKQRMVPRYSMLAIAELVETAGTVCIVGRMTEVSSKGCYVNTPSTLPLNSFLKVVISRDDETFLTNGEVIYVHEGIGMGIVFVDSAEDQLKILNSWLADAPRIEML